MIQNKILQIAKDIKLVAIFEDDKIGIELHVGKKKTKLDIMEAAAMCKWLNSEVLPDDLRINPGLLVVPTIPTNLPKGLSDPTPTVAPGSPSLENRTAVSVLPSGPIPAAKKSLDLQVHNLTHEIGKAAVAFSKENLNRDQVITRDGNQTPNS